jgi:hypothetical protein
MAATQTPTAGSSGRSAATTGPWGPEREIFGTVRYMSSENTARKVRVKAYLARYAEL